MIATSPSATSKRLPGTIDATHLITMLFGSDTTCKVRKLPLKPEECCVVATYFDNEGTLKRLLTCDLAFANSAGAALTAIPPVAASKATQSGKMAENAFENLIEVMNVAVNLFIESFGARLQLGPVTKLSDATPEVLAALSGEQRAKFDIAIPRYDVGRIDLIAV